ncbi:hypothetical protein PoB_005858300 [Plakobranchus ocellatus]|uniref:Uncharacterized protein n=1 Tax=Plakobranchus ocellatus TaxID=259542 RepID=A0AAV4CJD3_9GAST|nr:hypothetical protein PoB_005858300 [Plakobranchus ocellatus]
MRSLSPAQQSYTCKTGIVSAFDLSHQLTMNCTACDANTMLLTPKGGRGKKNRALFIPQSAKGLDGSELIEFEAHCNYEGKGHKF